MRGGNTTSGILASLLRFSPLNFLEGSSVYRLMQITMDNPIPDFLCFFLSELKVGKATSVFSLHVQNRSSALQEIVVKKYAILFRSNH